MRSSRKPVKGAEGIFEPNMTPIIDVSLVLVVILMVATPLAFQSGIAVNAASPTGKAVAKTPEARVELQLANDGSVWVNREHLQRPELTERLGVLLAGTSSRTVVVRCEDAVTHGAFVSVLDEVRSHEGVRIAVVGD